MSLPGPITRRTAASSNVKIKIPKEHGGGSSENNKNIVREITTFIQRNILNNKIIDSACHILNYPRKLQ